MKPEDILKRLEDKASSLATAEVKLGDPAVKFNIKKLPALDAFDLLERMRHAYFTGDINASHIPGSKDKAVAAFSAVIQGVLSLAPDVVADIRDTVFASVTFSGNGVQASMPIPLLDNESLAFANLEPTEIYELIVRCLVVNFKKSFSGMVSDLAQLLVDADSLKL